MNRQEALSILLEEARLAGVPAAEAIALWEQESGFSTDINLPHQELSRGRGHAVGPFGIVPYYHQKADLSSLRSQAKYALNEYKRVGPRGYYGTGKPPPGFPITDEYVQQLSSKASQYHQPEPKPKLQAATMFNFVTPDQQPPAATPDQPGPPEPDLSQFLGPPMMEDRPLDPVQRLMNDPLTHIGLGILATPTGQGSWLQGVARGTLAGMQAFQAQQRLNAEIEDTLERQRQRAARKEMENARIRLAATMPGLSDLERNLLITDPNAFGQIYAAKMQQQQQQQQADAYNRALGIPPVGAGAPSLTPTGGEYPRAMPGQVPVETQTIPPSIPGMPPGEIQVDTVSPPMTLPGGIQAPSQVTPGAGPMPGQAPPAAVPPGQIPLNPAAIARAGDYPRAIDVQREINRQEFERQQSWEAEQRRIAGEQRSQAFQQQQALEAEQRRIAGEQRAQEFQVGRSQIEQESSLRKELHQHPVYQLNLKASHIAEAAPALMRRALEEGSATAGETMVTELSKIIDPGAASMLSEKQALQTNTILDDMQKWYQYFKGGNKVTIEKLQEIYNVIEDHRIASARSAQAVEKDYQYIAQKRNLDFGVIVPKPITDDMLKPRSIPIASKPGRRQLSRTPEGFSVEEED